MRFVAVSKIWPRACQAEKAWMVGVSSSAAASGASSSSAIRERRRRVTAWPMSGSGSVEIDVDGIAAQRESEALALGLQRKRHTARVGEPELSGAPVTDGYAVAALDVAAGEILDL